MFARAKLLAPREELVPQTNYASSAEFRAAVSRAQWAVVQTGLITSGLALFGVYVLATRINDLHLMSMYVWDWLPFGPLLVGLIAGSGYMLASWWFGVRVGPGLVLAIMLLQFAMFVACHYADFETRDLVYRDTGQPVSFATFFDRMTRRLGQQEIDPADAKAARGYAIRFAEAMCFALGGMLSALTLVGRPKCSLCGGLVRSRSLGTIGGPRVGDVLKRLEERARLGDVQGFEQEVASTGTHVLDYESSMELTLTRCEVCGVGSVQRAERVVDPTQALPVGTTEPSSRPTPLTSRPRGDLTWRVDVSGEFARQLFEQKSRPQAQPRPTDAAG